MLKQLGIGHQAARPALLGAEASEYVGSLLRSKGPDIAVHELQAGYSLQHPLCRPLLIMMDTMQVSRREVHLHVLNRARRLLLDWIAAARAASEARAADMRPDAPEPPEELELQERLERLLNASFKYMGVPELKQACCCWSAAACCALHVRVAINHTATFPECPAIIDLPLPGVHMRCRRPGTYGGDVHHDARAGALPETAGRGPRDIQ
jgi:hypothetical protein